MIDLRLIYGRLVDLGLREELVALQLFSCAGLATSGILRFSKLTSAGREVRLSQDPPFVPFHENNGISKKPFCAEFLYP